MLRVVVLGAAAGGGVPQWNCGCPVCRAARSEHPELRSTQASIAISADGEHWFLINASPDLRQQLTATPQLHPRAGKLRHSPVAGVILTNGEIDAVAGLLSMREGSPFTIYAHRKVLAILGDNSIFNVLNEKNVRRQPIEIDTAFEPALPDGSPSGIEILPFAVAGKGAWYLEGKTPSRGQRRRRRHAGAANWRQGDGQAFLFSRRLRRCHRRSQIQACRRVPGLLRRHGVARRRADRGRPRDQDRARHGTYRRCQAMAARSKPCRASISAAKCFCTSTIPTRRCCTIPPNARWPNARAGKSPPMERRLRCERDNHERDDSLLARRQRAAEQRRGTGSRPAPHRRDPLSQPASVSPAAARRQAEQGPGAGLGAEPLLLPEHHSDQGRGGDLALPRPRHPHGMAASDRGP